MLLECPPRRRKAVSRQLFRFTGRPLRRRMSLWTESGSEMDAAVRAEELRGRVSGLYVERVLPGKPRELREDKGALVARIHVRTAKTV